MGESSRSVTVVALLADPDAPTEVAQRIARDLPARLAAGSGRHRRFDVEVISEPFTAETEDLPTLTRRLLDRGRGEDWDIVVGLTDLPLHAQGRKLVVELSHEHGLALLSLPSLGGLRFQRRARRAVERVVLSLADARTAETREAQRRSAEDFISRPASVHRDRVGDEEAADLRYVLSGPRGYLRMLAGMVRANRPWRLVPGLSKALAAALATGAIATVNSTLWNLAASLDTPRLVIAMVGSIALMIGWLIVDARLWHRSARDSPEAKRQAALYNASTVVTVGIGVLVCYAGLLVVNLLWALFILNGQVFTSLTRSPLTAAEYWTLAWFVASVATVGGALGSGLESDEAIRSAAYSKREQERRRMLDDDQD
ncbi:MULTISPECIES: hypothetical protein [Streptomyces]|uniref:hypothetical protein n=1 Tax=Streptomyces TaxID=1883 RepID=UPI001CF9E2B0|nr:hypothetical protein [Streptomyces parvulus]